MPIGFLKRLVGKEESGKATRKVLIVDDDPDVRRLLDHYLKPLDCRIKHAVNISEAMEILKKDSSYRLIILDILMPGGNGIDLLKTIRKTPGISKIPVLVCSGALPPSKLQEIETRYKRARVLMKPLRLDTFRQKVEEAFETGYL